MISHTVTADVDGTALDGLERVGRSEPSHAYPRQPELEPRRLRFDRATFEISIVSRTFGVIEKVGEGLPEEVIGKRCYEVIAGRQAPCSGCPASGVMAVGDPIVGVNLTSSGDGFSSRAIRLEQDRALVTIVSLGPRFLARLILDRLQSLNSQLSLREQAVLKHLAFGVSIDEIARTLMISSRTVKFHQANILRKLEIESRAALLFKIIDSE